MGLDVPLSYDVLEEDDSIAAPRSAFDIFAAPLPEDFRTTSPRERNVVPEQPVANPRAFARSKKARSFFTSEPAAEAISDGSEEEKQEDDMTNPFENVELNEEEGAFNFEIPLLEKSREWNRGLNVVMNLSAYSIDPNYVTPEERVMRDLLSSPDPAISFMGFVGLS